MRAVTRRPFRDWPIKRKLLTVILATTTVALGFAAAGILAVDSVLFRYSLERDLSALSEIIADNSIGALAFDDTQAATETLAALRARPHLIAACIYRSNGAVLARYARENSRESCPDASGRAGLAYVKEGLSIARPVMLEKRRVGTLTLLYDLREIAQRRLVYGATVLAIFILSSILAGLFSSRLRDSVAVPVIKLAEAATSVSSSQDYTIRAKKISGDEMGVLVDAFNDMLGRIQSRDGDLRELLRDREEANRQLVLLNEDLERFAFVASHDLQEPLRMISIYTQLLQKRALLTPGPDTDEIVAHITGGARRMRELLDDLRAYAELGATGEPPANVELNAVFSKATQNLALSIKKSGAAVTSDELPVIQGYEGHLVPLFQNLIGNAIKYRSEAMPHVHVGYAHDGDLLFSVSDNGIGIPGEFHETIFVPFKRLHGSNIPGSGLGLAICKRVVERYGGRIWVDSQPGQGTTFRFTLPEHLLVSRSLGKGSVM
jgi:signal transduction histidine kinase